MSPLLSLTILLTAAVLAVALVRRLGLPSILAYLAIGAALGPHGMAFVATSEAVEAIAEFGVVFLMFSIGLEFNLKRLKTMRAMVFGLGPAQLLATAAATTLGTTWFYQQSWRSGLAVGLAVAMSSTAIVARMLSERFELHSRSARPAGHRARARRKRREKLKQAGASEVIPEVLEGSLMIAAETLAQLGVPMERAIAQARKVRAERYASLREFYQSHD